jgi:hypothetical protein
MDKPNLLHWERPVLHWDRANSHHCYDISQDGFEGQARAVDVQYFSSVIADKAFVPGKQYYYELSIKSPSRVSAELQVKVGITTEQSMQVGYGFSDKETGWSYYLEGNGYTRHCSNSDGRSYGSGYKVNQTLGVYVDLLVGTLAFSVDGDYFGLAFDDLSCDRPYYAAVAMNNANQYCELLRKTPACWENRAPALFVRKYAEARSVISALKTGLFREAINFL